MAIPSSVDSLTAAKMSAVDRLSRRDSGEVMFAAGGGATAACFAGSSSSSFFSSAVRGVLSALKESRKSNVTQWFELQFHNTLTSLLVAVLWFRPRMIWSTPRLWVPSGSSPGAVRFEPLPVASVPAEDSRAYRHQLGAVPWSGRTFEPVGQTCSDRWAPDRDLWPVGCAGRYHRRKHWEQCLPPPKDTLVERNLWGGEMRIIWCCSYGRWNACTTNLGHRDRCKSYWNLCSKYTKDHCRDNCWGRFLPPWLRRRL